MIRGDCTDLQCSQFLKVLPLLTDKSEWKNLSLLPLLVLFVLVVISTPAYSIAQIKTIPNPNINMIAKNAPVSQSFNPAFSSGQANPKIFYSRWGFGVIDFSSSPLEAGTVPDCQVGGAVNPSLNNFNYNYNYYNNNNNNILSLISPEIVVIPNIQSNNMITIGPTAQPGPTFQNLGPNSASVPPVSPLASSLPQPIRSVKVMLPNGFFDERTIIEALQLQPGTYSVVSNNCIVDTLQVPSPSSTSFQTQPATSSAGSPFPGSVQSSAPLPAITSLNAKPSMLLPGSNANSAMTSPSLPFPAQITQTPPSFGLFTQLNGQTILPVGPSSNSAQAPGTFQAPFQLRPVQPLSPPFLQIFPP